MKLVPLAVFTLALLLWPASVLSAHATFSGSNGQIAFTSDRDGNEEIYVMAADGDDQAQAYEQPGDDRFPAWSAAGGRIVFTSDRDGDQEIYTHERRRLRDGETDRQLRL